ncbi:DEVIL 11, ROTUNDIFOLIA like 8 [Hibiscus trionum]|uniref:DEVIL 11, ROTUNDIFOLIA like 8 n=1 Tax=Hibiscus trionum TaxID=183268 RepID=A0A9W7M673_HIBTR|nr:DEVIL 11, ROTUNDIFOLIA like 8 [Hibiscus trionum]
MDSSSSSAAPPPSFYLDEKWRLSRKDSRSKSAPATPASKRCAFTRKCAKLVREQRARFYIMRRCVIMLICWRDYADS